MKKDETFGRLRSAIDRSGDHKRPEIKPGVEFPTLREWIDQLKALDYHNEFVLHEGKLLHPASGRSYGPEKVRISSMHHFRGAGSSPNLLFLLQTTDGRRGWVAEMADGAPSRSLAAFLEKVLAESNTRK